MASGERGAASGWSRNVFHRARARARSAAFERPPALVLVLVLVLVLEDLLPGFRVPYRRNFPWFGTFWFLVAAE